MIRRILFMAGVLLFSPAFSQQASFQSNSRLQACGFDEYMSFLKQEKPGAALKRISTEKKIAQYLAQQKSSRLSNVDSLKTNYVIPVVVHVIYDASVGLSNISNAQIDGQIDALNLGFQETNIKFCLASKDSNGVNSWNSGKPGVIRIPSALSYHHATENERNQLVKLSSFPSSKYLNIWVVSSICMDANSCPGNIAGYSTFPDMGSVLDGIVIRYDAFGDNRNGGIYSLRPGNDQGKTLVHETGHYLNLYHPFQGGCPGSGMSCSNSGDYVCDTPPVDLPSVDCPAAKTSCTGGQALVNNYMEYTADVCRTSFTAGQKERLLASLMLFRPTLFSDANVSAAGVTCYPPGLLANFSEDKTQVCAGDTIRFSTFSNAVVFDWSFPGGTPRKANTMIPPPIVYNTPGVYDVILTVSDGSTSNPVARTTYKRRLITVDKCAPITGSQANWYFGNFAGLSFKTGKPVSVAVKTPMYSSEACASVSDVNGNLLFYTNGREVYDRRDSLISAVLNGSPNLGAAASAAQGALIVPDPGNSQKYYIFTVSDGREGSINNGLCYTIINMAAKSGFGDVVPGKLNVPVTGSNPNTTEHLAAIPHCNGTDYWIVVHGAQSGFESKLIAYQLSASGISSTVLSDAYPVKPSFIQYPQDDWAGTIQASPDGRYVAVTKSAITGQEGRGDCYIYRFNKSNGEFSFVRRIKNVFGYYTEFSPGSRFLYMKNTSYLYQVDMSKIQDTTYTGAHININPPYNGMDAMQLAPDGKIYLAGRNSNLAVISSPDSLITFGNPNAVGYSEQTPITFVSGSFPIQGLPNMIDAKAGVPQAGFEYSFSGCSTINFSNTSCGSSFHWDFGDGDSSLAENPVHTYTTPGDFKVTFTLVSGSGKSIVSKMIHLDPFAAPIIAGLKNFTTFNRVYSYSVNAVEGVIYTWKIVGGTPVTGTGTSIDVQWNPKRRRSIQVFATSAEGCKDSAFSKSVGPMLDSLVIKSLVCSSKLEYKMKVYGEAFAHNFQIQIYDSAMNYTKTVYLGPLYYDSGIINLTNLQPDIPYKIIIRPIDTTVLELQQYLTILRKPVLSVTQEPVLFYSAHPLELNCANPQGGQYSGKGIVDNVLDPRAATYGTTQVKYVYTAPNGCKDSINFKARVTDSCSPYSELLSNDVYPNPGNGLFNFCESSHIIELLRSKFCNVSVYDTEGRRVFYADYYSFEASYIDLRDQNPGIYTLEIITNDATLTRKLVISPR